MDLMERGDAEGLARRVAQTGGLPTDQFEVLSECMRALVDGHRRDSASISLGELYYRPQWDVRPRGAATRPATGSAGRWLILADQGGLGHSLVRLLEAEGGQCVVLPGGDLRRNDDGTWRLDERRLAELDSSLREAAGANGAHFRGLIHLWSRRAVVTDIDSRRAGRVSSEGCGGALHACVRPWPTRLDSRSQAVAGDARRRGGRSGPSGGRRRSAPSWGIGRVIRLEHPDLWVA